MSILDSLLVRAPQIENVSPPVVNQAAQPNTNPPSSTITTAPAQGHYYQQGYKFKGMPGKDPSPISQDVGTQHLTIGQQVLNTNHLVQNTQSVGNVYSQGIPVHNQNIQAPLGMIPTQPAPPHGQVIAPAHGQVIAPHEQIPVGLDQGQYAYGMGQPQQQQPQQQQPQQQQQHLHSYTPNQMQSATQWQAQQQGLGPGWMK